MANIDKIIKSKYQPKQTNVAWVDLSGETPIEKHFINGRWVAVSGGGGGTKKYSDLEEKPLINGVELDGNKTSQDLGVYSKPLSGIPQSDLAQGVQTSLNKADTAYQKPSNGIPESDLSSDVQQALQKHFKGWLTSTSQLPSNPVVGDYAYVEDNGTTYIYRCATDGEWPSTSTEEKDPVDVTFADGQEVNEVHIVNDLTTGGTEDVLSAEQGNVLNDKISTINDTLYDTTQIAVDLSGKQSGYYNAYETTIGTTQRPASLTSGGFYTTNIACQAGETYIASSHNGGVSMTQILIWDSNDYLVGYYNRGDSANHYDFQFTIPQNGVLLSFCGRSVSPYRYELLKVISQNVIDTLSDSVDTLSDSVDTLSDNFDEITEIYVSPNMFDKTQVPDDNKVISTEGDLQNIPSWTFNKHTPLIPVEPNKYYRISGCNISGGNNIRCVAANGTTAMKVLAPATGTEYANKYQMPNADGTGTSVMNTQFKTPSTAAYVQFNVATDRNDATDTTMIELVGDTYNPDFVPSEYEEYGSKILIKESALPNIDFEEIDEAIEKSDNAVSRKFKVKLLLVGSSHGMNTISQFPWIAYKSGIDIEVGNVYIGSFSLQRLVGMNERSEKCTLKYFKDGVWTSYTNKSFAEVFGYTDWDFVSVQRSATDDQLWITTQNEADTIHNSMTNINYNTELPAVYMSHNEALQYVLNLIRNNATKQNCEVIFNTGFADPSEGLNPSQTSDIISTAKDMKEQFGIDYVPVAIAVRNARNTYLRHFGNYTTSNANATNQLCYDSQHLDYGIGCYVPSMCLLEFVCRKIGWGTINLKGYGTQAEVGSFISLALTDANYTEPTDETMIVAKACAMCACDMLDSTSTKLSDRFKWQISYNLSNSITASNTKGYCGNLDTYSTTLSGTISSVVITSKPWDRTQPSTTLVEGTDYTYDSSTGKIVIGSVLGDITISAN